MRRPTISLVITDLDNTIYDWLAAFVPAFYAMVREAAPIIGVTEEVLLDDLKRVHQRYGDSEHPFALLEAASVKRKWKDLDQPELAQILDPAFHAFNRIRKQSLRLYPSVFETLQRISTLVPIVAYTDARVINSLFRLDHLKVKDFFSRLYAPTHIAKDLGEEIRSCGFVHLLATGDRKPNPQTLIDICSEYSVAASDALYVGDSLARDIYMAKSAGLHSAWAKFGTLYDKSLWPQLVRITHWTEADVERENELKQKVQGIEPEFTLNAFGDLLKCYDFEAVSMPIVGQSL